MRWSQKRPKGRPKFFRPTNLKRGQISEIRSKKGQSGNPGLEFCEIWLIFYALFDFVFRRGGWLEDFAVNLLPWCLFYMVLNQNVCLTYVKDFLPQMIFLEIVSIAAWIHHVTNRDNQPNLVQTHISIGNLGNAVISPSLAGNFPYYFSRHVFLLYRSN